MYKLMIVEDEPIERKALRMILSRHFFNLDIVEDAKNGIEAVDLAKIYKPDIILMDIKMPENTGLEAQKRIIKFLPEVKTIVLTAYSDFNYAQEAIKSGAVDYLLKPANAGDIKTAVEKAIASIQNKESLKTNHPQPIDVSENVLEAAMSYIEKNFTEKITLDTVANFVHLHPQYFSKYFKKNLGITFTDYIAKLRIEKAKNLMIHPEKTIAQVALEVGYTDPAYFSKVFLKYEQQSPYKYKRNNI
ncbi:response regulator transcription factor [Clostridium formicaceticum]|uniref:Stage 0 sporulation protein A homolog n=1 Tax=Clostridium formicaceticum TaxID=1497 RepID=A0AAC9RLQ3_9CLOT|nr:response regulator [Clostridium formicaceticum]AOY77133.1 DNA-binding response regulator [Clostridium formicaceticum]ARE87648.1 putative response regulatory protein [Clostridium formicaceticum]